MYTRSDVTLVEAITEPGYARHHVRLGDQNYVLQAVNMSPEDITETSETQPELGFLYAIGFLPTVETFVAKGDDDFNMIGECGPDCETGVCTRRLTSTQEYGDIEKAYSSLVDFANA